MNTGWISKRWLGVTLLVALFTLLAAITLQVRPGQHSARFALEPNIRGSSPGSAIRSLDDISAVEYEMTGNELGLDSAGGAGLKRFEFVSPGEGAMEYLFEREGADYAQDAGFAPRTTIRSLDDSSAVEYEMTGNELGLDSAGGAGWERIRFAPVGEAYWDYVLALESNATSR